MYGTITKIYLHLIDLEEAGAPTLSWKTIVILFYISAVVWHEPHTTDCLVNGKRQGFTKKNWNSPKSR